VADGQALPTENTALMHSIARAKTKRPTCCTTFAATFAD